MNKSEKQKYKKNKNIEKYTEIFKNIKKYREILEKKKYI